MVSFCPVNTPLPPPPNNTIAPPAPPRMPHRNGFFARGIGHLYYYLSGWRMVGELPNEPRVVAVVAPHTTNWDLVVCAATLLAYDMKLSYMIKHTALQGPLAPLLRWLGAMGIDRTAAHGVVGETIAAFNAQEKLWVAIAPEGTRSGSGVFKKGFLAIAKGAEVPMLLVALDWHTKRVRLLDTLPPPVDVSDATLAAIAAHFQPYARPKLRKSTDKPNAP